MEFRTVVSLGTTGVALGSLGGAAHALFSSFSERSEVFITALHDSDALYIYSCPCIKCFRFSFVKGRWRRSPVPWTSR